MWSHCRRRRRRCRRRRCRCRCRLRLGGEIGQRVRVRETERREGGGYMGVLRWGHTRRGGRDGGPAARAGPARPNRAGIESGPPDGHHTSHGLSQRRGRIAPERACPSHHPSHGQSCRFATATSDPRGGAAPSPALHARPRAPTTRSHDSTAPDGNRAGQGGLRGAWGGVGSWHARVHFLRERSARRRPQNSRWAVTPSDEHLGTGSEKISSRRSAPRPARHHSGGGAASRRARQSLHLYLLRPCSQR